ncbi:hypothetical protein CP532_6122 [Ophiocordyceps camponoti-leonardi (nom. inval.)]|nr:hypothetical protein CP532_6122 [Ophiocordyceps camponoti-leonardi (nom. inval.)]
MAFIESKIKLPDTKLDNETVGAGFSSRVLRLDAGAKYYSSIEKESLFTNVSGPPTLGIKESQYFRQQSECQPVPLSTRLLWAEQTTNAIAFLHSKNTFHRNNVFVDENTNTLPGTNALLGDFAESSLDEAPCLSWQRRAILALT